MSTQTTMDGTRYHPDYTRALDGDVAASLMLSQIVYWYMPDSDGRSKLRVFRYGRWWLVKSFRDWETELGFSQKQSGRCLRVLKERGLIVTITAKFNIQTVTHVRLVGLEGKDMLECPEALFTIANGPFQNCLKDIPLTETTPEKTTESKPAMPSACALPHPDLLQNQPGETTPMATTKEISERRVEKKGIRKPSVVNKTSALHVLWRDVRHQVTGRYQPDLTKVQQGQLKGLYVKLGVDTGPVVEWVLRNWKVFGSMTASQKGLYTSPTVPVPGFLLEHADVALDAWRRHTVIKVVEEVVAMEAPKARIDKPKPQVHTEKTSMHLILEDLRKEHLSSSKRNTIGVLLHSVR